MDVRNSSLLEMELMLLTGNKFTAIHIGLKYFQINVIPMARLISVFIYVFLCDSREICFQVKFNLSLPKLFIQLRFSVLIVYYLYNRFGNI